MKEILTKKEIHKEYEEINELLGNKNLLDKERVALEQRKIELAIMETNHWLPADIGRKILIFSIFIFGMIGIMIGSYALALTWLIIPIFSPKMMMKLLVVYGKSRQNKQ